MAFSIPQNLAQQIADHISEQIVRMEMLPGERILEAKIAEDLQVSRSPVREAFRILERYRLVELIPRKGARVTEMDAHHLDCMFELMNELVALIARLCSQRRTQEQMDTLVNLCRKAELYAREETLSEYFDTIFQYGQVCLAATDNPLLGEAVLDWLPGFRRAYFKALAHEEYDFEYAMRFLSSLTEFFTQKDAVRAEKATREHAMWERARMEKNSSLYEYQEKEQSGLSAS